MGERWQTGIAEGVPNLWVSHGMQPQNSAESACRLGFALSLVLALLEDE